MNYRHAYHAGNFADLLKHVALVTVILHLRRKEKPFLVIDTHAGAGLYDLGGPEARQTREAAGGIQRIGSGTGEPVPPEPLLTYFQCVHREGHGRYPGSSRIAAQLLRPQDRLVAIEKHPKEAVALRHALCGFPNARAEEGDGYKRLPALLPPRERRGVVLIDPPYEAGVEFLRTAELLARAYRCFATGIYLVWYPIKSRGEADAFCGEVRAQGIAPILRLEIDIGRRDASGQERLSAAGQLIINAPFGFEAEMARAAAFLAPRLGSDAAHPATITLAPA
jgi:23S rRNA (adenine2030-N6)-methyltransferase